MISPSLPLRAEPARRATAHPQSVTLTLPYPVSGNRYKAPLSVRGKGVRWYLTAEAKAYKSEVVLRARLAGIRKPFEGRVSVHMRIYPALPKDWVRRMRRDPLGWADSVRCLDLDNARKVLLDALNGVAYVDDRWIWRDSAERMAPDGEARVVVTVAPLERSAERWEAACA